jgi:hypothetical protein
MNSEEKFPEWEGYKHIEDCKKVIFAGCLNDQEKVLEYAAKMSIERNYFFNLLLFVQDRIEKYYFEGKNKDMGIGIDSSKEIFEGLMLVPSEQVGVGVGDGDDDIVGDDDISIDKYEQFVKDMEKAGIEYEEYHGRYFYHGPAVKTKKGFPTLEDIIRSTKVKLQWDNLGLGHIVYPI